MPAEWRGLFFLTYLKTHTIESPSKMEIADLKIDSYTLYQS